ncbi:MAG: PEP-CTERM sorting domain-containing protein [Methylophilaceae bacterium]
MLVIRIKSILSTLLVFTAFTTVANANVYNLADFPLSFNGATSLVGSLETSQTGVFNTESAIESFLNASTYSVTLSNGASEILNLNNSNSAWDLVFSFEPGNQTTSASLIADSQAITLNFGTPAEVTEVSLFLRNSTFGYIRYFQSNNITDNSSFDAQFDPMTNAFSAINYGSSFVLPSVSAVPEPSNVMLMLSGLACIAFYRRRNSV